MAFDLVIDYYQRLLLRQGRGPYLDQLLTEALAACEAHRSRLRDPGTQRQMPLLTGRLHLLAAESRLRQGGSATGPLARAAVQLAAVRRAFTPEQRQFIDYYPLQTAWWGLCAWQQPAPADRRRLLTTARAALDSTQWPNMREQAQRRLAEYCVAMQQPATAVALLTPLVRPYAQHQRRLLLYQVYDLLRRAHAGTGRFDSAYHYAGRQQALADTLRAGRHYAALAAAESRYRLRELTERSRAQAREARWAWGSALLLAGLLTAVGLALRLARRRGRLLAAQHQQLQAQAARLAALDQAKNQFFANVSHELRTPLTLVLGPLEGLLARAQPLPPAVREPLTLALRHGRRLHELVNRILELTKLQAGRLELRPEPVRVAPLLRRLVGQFDSAAAERGLRLLGPADLPEQLMLCVDADKVEQVLTNLVANALKHTPAGGTVSVTADLTEPAACTLTVRDTGPGIAPEEQGRVFERYYQSPQAQAQGGTGLGLALSRELAELLGGSLTLHSRVGEGATFTFRFHAERLPDAPEPAPAGLGPALAEAATEQPALANPPPAAADAVATTAPLVAGAAATVAAGAGSAAPGGPSLARVLVVDDHADLRAYLRQLLAPHYTVVEAEDGRQALAVLAREAIDLVVSDAMMPHVSGTELLQQLKADPDRRGLPFLMLTARADEAHRLSALETGVDDYLTKPFAPAELLTRAQALLARYRVRQHYAALPAEAFLEVEEALSAPAAPAAPAEAWSAEAPAVAPDLLPQWRAVAALRLTDPDFGPADLAAALHLSERTLYRRLSELAGLTPAAWLRELRLDHARRLLESGHFGTVAEVAYAAGFVNAKHFSTLFAQRFGRKPSDYRR